MNKLGDYLTLIYWAQGKQCLLWDHDRCLRDHKTCCFPVGPVNKCFINISSVKVIDGIKKTKTVFIEENDTK